MSSADSQEVEVARDGGRVLPGIEFAEQRAQSDRLRGIGRSGVEQVAQQGRSVYPTHRGYVPLDRSRDEVGHGPPPALKDPGSGRRFPDNRRRRGTRRVRIRKRPPSPRGTSAGRAGIRCARRDSR